MELLHCLLQLVEMLLKAGADKDKSDNDGITYCIWSQKMAIVIWVVCYWRQVLI